MKAFRGQLFHALSESHTEFWEDGLLLVRPDGTIEKAGPAAALQPQLFKDVKVEHHPDCLILPGFIDVHTHFSQVDVVGSPARDTLQWLERHTFPAEAKFADSAHAREVARAFLRELLSNGTTSALCFATVHPDSIEALFEEAAKSNLRLAGGKVMMDRNAPSDLCDAPASSVEETRALIKKWHGRGRLQYAITPRFAPTSSEDQLRGAASLLQENPEVLLQTHLAETPDEVTWVKQLFPKAKSYLGVYDQFGLTSARSVFAHCIHLSKEEFELLAQRGSGIAFCPSSNLFLGSGLFPLETARAAGVKVGLATDIGGGTTFSMWKTMALAHHVVQLQGKSLSAIQAITLATLGSARVLGWEKRLGNFESGKEADFVVWDPQAQPLLARRWKAARSPEEKVFACMILADDRNCKATYILGNRAHG